MRLVKGNRIVEDRFVRVLDDAPMPDSVPVIVPAARFLADHAELSVRSAPIGVLWPNNRNISELAPYLDRLALVGLVFPAFKDGRAYSQAHILRARYRFTGEIRATGEVLVDMMPLLARTGVDAVVLRHDQDRAAAERALGFFATMGHYQGDVVQTKPAFGRAA